MASQVLLKTGTANQRKIFFACLLTAGFFSLSAGRARADSHNTELILEPTSPARLLLFPGDISLGFLHLEPRTNHTGGGTPGKGLSVQARGKINVPKNTFVTFEANKEFFKNPSFIGKFPANAFDGIQLRMLSMDDAEDDFCDRALTAISHLKGLSVLNVDRSEVSDAGLKTADTLPNLQHITAFLTPVRGAFLQNATALKKLRMLELDSCGLKEEYLQYLPQYPSLVCLKVSHSNLSDKAVQYISKCAKLEDLDISKNPAIDDQAMTSLKTLKTLRYLSLFDTKVTLKGILTLKGLKLVSLILPGSLYPNPVMAQLKAAFPEALISARGTKSKVDDYTKTIFSPMTR